jgi:DNA-binding MarR family transcriptional regulator
MPAATTSSTDFALWRDIVVLRQRVERSLEQRLQKDAGISVADFEILTVLAREDAKRLRARDLGDLLGWEKSRLSHQVTRMESRGLVVRQDCPTDLRGTWVVLTDDGAAAGARALDGHGEVLQSHFDALDADQRDGLEQAVRRLVDTSTGTECTGPTAC